MNGGRKPSSLEILRQAKARAAGGAIPPQPTVAVPAPAPQPPSIDPFSQAPSKPAPDANVRPPVAPTAAPQIQAPIAQPFTAPVAPVAPVAQPLAAPIIPSATVPAAPVLPSVPPTLAPAPAQQPAPAPSITPKQFLAKVRLYKKWIAAVVSAIGLLGGGGITFSKISSCRMEKEKTVLSEKAAKERTEKINSMAEKIRRCRAAPALPEGCLSEDAKAKIRKGAGDFEGIGDYLSAGMQYVRIDDFAKAKEMATKLRGEPKEGEDPDPEGEKSAKQIEDAIRQRIAESVSNPGKCAAKPPAGCLTEQEKDDMGKSAARYEAAGAYKEAGLMYVKLGNEQKAKEMADKCREAGKQPQGTARDGCNAKGAEEIEAALKESAEALEKSVSSAP